MLTTGPARVLNGFPPSALAVVLICTIVVGSHAGGKDVSAAKSAQRSPNVLLITLCSVRPDHMSCYGYQRDTTPNLTTLAREAIVFDAAFTQWPKTAPGFAAIATAQYGHTNGIMRLTPRAYLDRRHVTLAEVFKAAGYQTAAFISAGAIGKHTNILQGFDVIRETWRTEPRFIAPSHLSLPWFSAHDPRKPFFVWVHYNNAHYAYNGGGAPPDMFVDDQYYDPSRKVEAVLDHQTLLSLDVSIKHPNVKQIRRPDIGRVHRTAVLPERPNEYAFYIARYDAGIFGADLAIGMLLDGLRDMKLLDNTIIVVVGDHGESLGDHNYYFEHGRFAYDACVRVPLMIRPPGGVPKRRIASPVASFGVAPTVLELAGLQRPPAWEAESLWPVASGSAKPGYVFTEAGYQLDYQLAVRDDQWKLIHVPNRIDHLLMTGAEYELYRWRDDPGETENLAARHPDQVQRLARVLREWSAPWLTAAYGRPTAKLVEVDEETLRHLEALGYVDTVREEEPQRQRDRPKGRDRH